MRPMSRRRNGIERRVAGQDGALQRPQLLTRVQAEFLHEQMPRDAEGLQRLGRAARPVQGEHVLSAQPFPERMLVDQLAQLTGQRMMPAERELKVNALLEQADAVLVQ